MVCPNCEANIAEGVQFCPNCGVNVFLNDVVTAPPAPKSKAKINLKLIGVGFGTIALIVLVIVIIMLINSNPGRKIANVISESLGRSVTIAEKNANITLEQSSEFSVLKNIVNYDFIYEAPNIVKVEGIRMPEWAIFVNNDENDKISSVVYYDFKTMERDWKGQKSTKLINSDLINYGMKMKDVERKVPLKPLSITHTNEDTVIYLYKYYFVDPVDKNDKAYYFTICYDINNEVTSVQSKENDYISYIFK